MEDKKLNIFIISEDLIFIQLIEVLLRHYAVNPNIEKFRTFTELVAPFKNTPDLIILDDIISGATIIEVISYLRLTKKLISKISFFSHDVYNIRTKAFERGVNYFYSKPFDPKIVVKEIVDNAHAKTR